MNPASPHLAYVAAAYGVCALVLGLAAWRAWRGWRRLRTPGRAWSGGKPGDPPTAALLWLGIGLGAVFAAAALVLSALDEQSDLFLRPVRPDERPDAFSRGCAWAVWSKRAV
jgi:hypothetical protein